MAVEPAEESVARENEDERQRNGDCVGERLSPVVGRLVAGRHTVQPERPQMDNVVQQVNGQRVATERPGEGEKARLGMQPFRLVETPMREGQRQNSAAQSPTDILDGWRKHRPTLQEICLHSLGCENAKLQTEEPQDGQRGAENHH